MNKGAQQWSQYNYGWGCQGNIWEQGLLEHHTFPGTSKCKHFLCLFETWRQALLPSFPLHRIPKTLFIVNLKGQKCSREFHICTWGPSAFLPLPGMLSAHWWNTEGQGYSRDFHLPNPGPRERLHKSTESNPIPCGAENITSLPGDTQAHGSWRPTDCQTRRQEYLAPG